ncbi:Plasminogen [Trichoplax sp. H2]|nr:Plasminogen [Trichoplax sp. H2]|eukprot:RDD38477.1 Plasminogen [Trichoplax sp. H2]
MDSRIIYLVVYLILPCLFSSIGCNTALHDFNWASRCLDHCHCQDENIRCKAIPASISAIPEGIKQLFVEEEPICDEKDVKNLIELALNANIKLVGYCKSANLRRKRSFNELLVKKLADSQDIYDETSHQRVKKAGFNIQSIYGFNENTSYATKCDFTKSACGWKQAKAIDFLDWKQVYGTCCIFKSKPNNINAMITNPLISMNTDSTFGFFLNTTKTYDDGQFAELISPPMKMPPGTMIISIRYITQLLELSKSTIKIYIMYPKYSMKRHLVETATFFDHSSKEHQQSYGALLPNQDLYHIIIRGKLGALVPGKSKGKFGLLYFHASPDEMTCYTGTGEYFRGSVATGESGKACVKWDSVSSPYNTRNYPHSQLNSNQCRNPGANRNRPWCYTSSKTAVWEYCSISACGSNNPAIPANPPYPLGFQNPVAITSLDNIESKTIGQAAVYVNGYWYRICYVYGYSPMTVPGLARAINLMCKQTGLGEVGSTWSTRSSFGRYNDTCIKLTDIKCPSTATSFSQCSVPANANPKIYTANQWLACYSASPKSPLTSNKYLLSIQHPNQNKSNAGIPNININSKESGGFCNRDWGLKEADVFCRQAGYLGASSSSINPPSSTIYPLSIVRSINCSGYEIKLSQCAANVATRPEPCLNGKGQTATVACIPKQSYYYTNNEPTNCQFTSGLCGWEVYNNVGWIWRQNDSVPFKPTQSVLSNGGYMYVFRSPYGVSQGRIILTSPLLTPNPSAGSVKTTLDRYAAGVLTNVTLLIAYENLPGSSEGGSSYSYYPIYATNGWQKFKEADASNGFYTYEKFTMLIGITWDYYGPPASFVFAIDNLVIHNTHGFHVNGTATATINHGTEQTTVPNNNAALGYYQSKHILLSLILSLLTYLSGMM